MPLQLDTYVARFTSGAGPQFIRVAMGGYFLQCLSAQHEFDVSIDGSPKIPFSVGCSLSPRNPDGSPLRFSAIELFCKNGIFVDNTITLLIGNIQYSGRLGIADAQYIREQGAARVVGKPYVWADNTTLGYMQIDGEAGQFMINVRNRGAVDMAFAIGDLSAADLNSLVNLGGGYLLGPGENVDVPSTYPSNQWSVAPRLYVKAPVNHPFHVSHFCYRV